MKPDGGSAFPKPSTSVGGMIEFSEKGMTLRDYFAAAALHGTRPGRAFTDAEVTLIALDCYRMADAMLAERAK